jgi:hypothetical protein
MPALLTILTPRSHAALPRRASTPRFHAALFLAVTSLASKARAQYTTAPAGPYTGGQVVGGSSVDPTSASYGPVSGGYGANGGASAGVTASCSGAITATFNWTGIAPAPQSAIVVETSSVFASADCYGYQAHGPPSAACADGIGRHCDHQHKLSTS